MLSFSRVLFILAILCSALITSLENVNALPVSVTRNAQNTMNSVEKEQSYFAQFRSSRKALTAPLKNYTDYEVARDPTIFRKVTEYEFLQALSAEGIDSSEDIVESHYDTEVEEIKAKKCDAIKTYIYYKCSDPKKLEVKFDEDKGLGYCPSNTSYYPPKTSHRRRSYRRRGTPSLPRGASSTTHGRTYSSTSSSSHRRYSGARYRRRPRVLQKLPSEARYRARNSQTFTGYKFLRVESKSGCKSLHGKHLRQIVSEFALKGKKEKYQKVIDRTFKRLRRRVKILYYVIKSETFEKNGKLYVRFFFNDKHTAQAEH